MAALKHVRGLEGLQEILRKFPVELARRHLLPATLAGSKVIKAEVERTVPVLSGLLQRSVVIGGPPNRSAWTVIDRIRITNRFWSPDTEEEGVHRVFTIRRGKRKGERVSFFASSAEKPPSAYGWLQERGYRKRGGRGRVQAKRFMGRAFLAAAPTAADVIAGKFKTAIEETALRLGGAK